VVNIEQSTTGRLGRGQMISLAVIGLQIGSLEVLPILLSEIFRPFLVIVSLIVILGTLTALVVYRQQPIPFWQIVGFGIGFGFGEALLLGRLLLALSVSTPWLGCGKPSTHSWVKYEKSSSTAS